MVAPFRWTDLGAHAVCNATLATTCTVTPVPLKVRKIRPRMNKKAASAFAEVTASCCYSTSNKVNTYQDLEDAHLKTVFRAVQSSFKSRFDIIPFDFLLGVFMYPDAGASDNGDDFFRNCLRFATTDTPGGTAAAPD